MWRDPIVEEVRKARDVFARRFNYDLEAMVRDVQARQVASGASFVDQPAKLTTAKRKLSKNAKKPSSRPQVSRKARISKSKPRR